MLVTLLCFFFVFSLHNLDKNAQQVTNMAFLGVDYIFLFFETLFEVCQTFHDLCIILRLGLKNVSFCMTDLFESLNS